MSKRIYLDTNIYLDYFWNRKTKTKNLGKYAVNILKRTIKCEFEIVISEFLIKELMRFIRTEELNNFFKKIKHKLINAKFEFFNELVDIKKRLKEIPSGDILHYLYATKNKAEILITNDNHFLLMPKKNTIIKKSLEL